MIRSPAGHVCYPHVSRAYLIEQHVIDTDGTQLPDITSLDITGAGPRSSPARPWPVAYRVPAWLRDTPTS